MGMRSIPYNTPIKLKFFNPLFNDISSYSLPMSFNSKIPAINRAFGFPNKADAEMKQEIEGRIKTRFTDLIGSWRVTKAGDEIEAYFTPGAGDFYCKIKDKLLTDIDFGGVRWANDLEGEIWPNMRPFLNSKMDVSYPESEYAAYTAYMPNAVNIDISDSAKIVNAVILPETGPMQFYEDDGNTAVYLFAGTVIDFLFENYGYKIEENIFREDPDLKQLTIFNTFNLRPPAPSEYYGKARIDFKLLVPHIACSDFLKAIRDRFNIGFFINEQQKSVRIVSFDNIITDGVRFSVCNTRLKSPSVENNRMTGLTFPKNEPDEWASHSYKSIDELKNPIIVVKYRDILPLTRNLGDIIFVQNEQSYYRIVLNEDDPPVNSALRISTDIFAYTAGDGVQEVTQLSGIPGMYTLTLNQEYVFYYIEDRHTADTDVDYVIPRCDLVGNGYDQPFTEFPLMFLFARGITDCYSVAQSINPEDPVYEYANLAAFPHDGAINTRYYAIDSGLYYRWTDLDNRYYVISMPEAANPPTFTYPLGTNDVYDINGSKIFSANLALKWGGDYGLIKRFWINRINWEMKIKKLIRANMLSEDISKLLDMSEWKRVSNSNYLVNLFELTVEGKNVRIENVELLRL
jgi:hypothetical protein